MKTLRQLELEYVQILDTIAETKARQRSTWPPARPVQVGAGVETVRLLREESHLAGRLEHLEAAHHDCGGNPGDLHLVAAYSAQRRAARDAKGGRSSRPPTRVRGAKCKVALGNRR
jgi:hypothetical protein